MSPRKKLSKASRAALKGWETRRRNERRARRAEAKQRRERAERKQARREAARRAAITKRTRAQRPPAVSGLDKWWEEGVLFYRTRELLLQDHPHAVSRRLAPDKESVLNYLSEIAGKSYFAVALVEIEGRTFYQPYFLPDLWTAPKDKRRSAKYRKKDRAIAAVVGLLPD